MLRIIGPLHDLTLKQLTLKTVALGALVSAQRSQTLAILSVDSMTKTQEAIQFVITNILKTSRPGKASLVVQFPALPENKKFCVYSSLLQ